MAIKNKKILFLILLFTFFGLTKNSRAASRMIKEDFEAGASWSYNANWDLFTPDLYDNWTITAASPHSGSYCAESENPGTGGIYNASGFAFTTPWITNWGDEIFIRWWAKFPTNWMPEATDWNCAGSAGGSNHMRVYDSSGTTIGEFNFIQYDEDTCTGGPPAGSNAHYTGQFLAPYGSPLMSPSAIFLLDNAWHEYALYIKMPTSSGLSDGIFREWRDNAGTYLAGDTFYNNTSVSWQALIGRIFLGGYYKGECALNWRFWMDDIEVWDGLPNGDTTALVAPSGLNVN